MAQHPEEKDGPCPFCKSDDPALAFDVLRPERDRRSAAWLGSDGTWNWVCPDDFHLDVTCPTCGSPSRAEPLSLTGAFSARGFNLCCDSFHSEEGEDE